MLLCESQSNLFVTSFSQAHMVFAARILSVCPGASNGRIGPYAKTSTRVLKLKDRTCLFISAAVQIRPELQALVKFLAT